MKIIIVVAVVLVALLATRFLGRTRGRTVLENSVAMVVPLSQAVAPDEAQVMSRFREKWGRKIGFSENPAWADPATHTRKYLLTDGQNTLMVTWVGVPLPQHLLEMTLTNSGHATDEEREALRSHKATISMEYKVGEQPPVERVRFTTMAMLTFLDVCPGIGYVSIAGQCYHPRRLVEPAMKLHALDIPFLYLFTVGLQVVDEGSTHYMHTHGLNQFGIPELQTRFADDSQSAACQSLITGASTYCIERGPVLKPGDSAQLTGDGVIYKILAVTGEDAKHYGGVPALEIARK